MLHDVHRRRRRRLGCALTTGLAAAALLGAGAPEPAEARACGAGGAGARERALCLINRQRAAHGLSRLAASRRMARAAGRHARDMARRGYFAHQRSGGPDLGARLRRAGWRGSSWGEAIAYACGRGTGPAAAVRRWMDSPPHRALILDGGFSRAGLGRARRAPVSCDGRAATWVLDVGRP